MLMCSYFWDIGSLSYRPVQTACWVCNLVVLFSGICNMFWIWIYSKHITYITVKAALCFSGQSLISFSAVSCNSGTFVIWLLIVMIEKNTIVFHEVQCFLLSFDPYSGEAFISWRTITGLPKNKLENISANNLHFNLINSCFLSMPAQLISFKQH